MNLRPVTWREAARFVGAEHRHNLPPRGWLFGVGLEDGGELVGVGIAGRPVARNLQDGFTAEITRVCTFGTKNANSMLYAALNRAAKALGYRRVITYTLDSESGSSLRAAGFSEAGFVDAHDGWSVPSRPRQDYDLFGQRAPHDQRKIRWIRNLDASPVQRVASTDSRSQRETRVSETAFLSRSIRGERKHDYEASTVGAGSSRSFPRKNTACAARRRRGGA